MSDATEMGADAKKWYNPMNLPDALATMADGKVDIQDGVLQENVRGQLIWTAIAFFAFGNSLGTHNTLVGNRRVHLGPVYIW